MTWCWLNTKVFIGFSIRSACTRTFPGIRRVNFTADELAFICDKIWIRTINFFSIKRGSWIQIRKILSDTILILLEKKNVFSYNIVASEVLFSKSLIWWYAQCWSTDSKLKLTSPSQHKCLCKMVCCNHCCAGKYMNTFCDTYLSLHWPLLVMRVFFIPICHYLYSHHQSFSNRATIIGHADMYLVKTNWEKNWHVPPLAEEKETFLRWFNSNVN